MAPVIPLQHRTELGMQRDWIELTAVCSDLSCSPCPGDQEWRLLSCPSPSTAAFFTCDVPGQGSHFSRELPGFRKSCVAPINAHYLYHTSNSEISEYFLRYLFTTGLQDSASFTAKLSSNPYRNGAIHSNSSSGWLLVPSSGPLVNRVAWAEPHWSRARSRAVIMPLSLLSVAMARLAPGFR